MEGRWLMRKTSVAFALRAAARQPSREARATRPAGPKPRANRALGAKGACQPEPRAKRAPGEGWRAVWDDFRNWVIRAGGTAQLGAPYTASPIKRVLRNLYRIPLP